MALRIGVITPHMAIGPEAEFPEMLPRTYVKVERVVSSTEPGGVENSPTSSAALSELMASPLLEAAAKRLIPDAVDVIGYASTTSAYAVGFDVEAATISKLSEVAGIPVASTCVAAVLALRALEVERVALVGAPWFAPDLNELGAVYFRQQGFDVVWSTSADLTLDPRQIEPTGVFEWTSGHVGDDVGAVFIGGNGFRAAGAIARLEGELGRPVLTSNQVLLWNLLALAGRRVSVNGYGRVFARSPAPIKPPVG